MLSDLTRGVIYSVVYRDAYFGGADEDECAATGQAAALAADATVLQALDTVAQAETGSGLWGHEDVLAARDELATALGLR